MNDPMQTILGLNAKASMFPPSSRYHGIETASIETHDGREIIYLKRRFVPEPERFVLIQEHIVVQGDRPDILAAKYLVDPEQFWRLCDANRVIDPGELTDIIGRRLRITLPEGMTGVNYV
jgi:hypothetical protein